MPQPRLLVYLVLFFASGAVALVYELLWFRRLNLLFGAGAFAAAATLGAFMAGLGIGSLWGARLASRHERPLRLYGYLELGVVAAAACLPLLLSSFDPLLAGLYERGVGPAGLNAARAAASFAALILPTTLMGATLPALSQAVVRSRLSVARPLGRLYGANTLGAALGAFGTGFLLLGHLGTRGTELLALGTNLAIGLAAIAAARRMPEASPRPAAGPETDAASRLPGILVAAFAVSGAMALAAEVVWTRTLVFYAGSTTYAFTLMIALFLLGLAGGSFLMSRYGDRIERRHAALAIVFAGVAAALIAGFAVLPGLARALDAWAMVAFSWPRALLVTATLAAVVVVPPALGFGAVFPLVARHEILRGRAAGRAAGRAYAANLGGAVAGAYAGGFLLVPSLGLYGTLRVLAAGLLLLAALLLFAEPERLSPRLRRAGALALAALAFLPLRLLPTAPLHRLGPGEKMVYYREGPSATVSVVRDPTGAKTLYIDRIGVAGTDPVMQTDQKSLAHLPMLIHPEPRSVLTVGFGSGGASWSYTRYPMLERIDCVEIAPEVVDAAPHLKEANHDLFSDPRYRVIFDDARSYLRFTDVRYDVIATDCTDLQYKSNASLYSVDYFDLCRRRLRPGGLVVVWMPLGGLDGGVFAMALNTFASVFPEVSIWYLNNYPTHYLLLLGSEEPHAVDWDRLLERMDIPAVRRDLESIALADPFRLLASFLMDGPEVRELVRGAEVNSDAWPLLELRAPRSADRFSGARNLAELVARARERTRPPPLVTRYGPRQRETVLGKLEPYLRAAALLNRGHVHYQNGLQDFETALSYYRRAAEANPDDRHTLDLVRATRESRDRILAAYQSAAREHPEDAGVLYNLGLTLLGAGEAEGALEPLRRLTDLRPDFVDARLALAQAARTAGELEEAAAAIEAARRLAPERAEVHFEEGMIFEALREPATALEAYRRATSLDPALAEAHFNAGTVLVMLDRLAEARAAYETGLAHAPDEAHARVNLAQILLLLGEQERALGELERAAASGEDAAHRRATSLLRELKGS